MTPIARLKRIGVLGGSSDQATADYYRRLNKAINDALGGWNTAELLINSMNFALVEWWVRNERWDEAGRYLAERAMALERAGAELLICVSNTLHRVADMVTAAVAIPFIHIVDPTATAIRAAGLARVGLLGTKPVMAGDFLRRRFAQRFGIEALVPETPQQEIADRIIFDELCRGQFTAESKAVFLAIVDALAARGAEGVVLGCTEIPMLITQVDRPRLPMFDTAALHVAAAVRMSLGDLAARPSDAVGDAR